MCPNKRVHLKPRQKYTIYTSHHDCSHITVAQRISPWECSAGEGTRARIWKCSGLRSSYAGSTQSAPLPTHTEGGVYTRDHTCTLVAAFPADQYIPAVRAALLAKSPLLATRRLHVSRSSSLAVLFSFSVVRECAYNFIAKTKPFLITLQRSRATNIAAPNWRTASSLTCAFHLAAYQGSVLPTCLGYYVQGDIRFLRVGYSRQLSHVRGAP